MHFAENMYHYGDSKQVLSRDMKQYKVVSSGEII